MNSSEFAFKGQTMERSAMGDWDDGTYDLTLSDYFIFHFQLPLA
jgi:hypothetical protein